MKTKKGLAFLLAWVLILAMIPTTGFAGVSGNTLNVICKDVDGASLNKTVSLEVPDGGGKLIKNLTPSDNDKLITVGIVIYKYQETKYNDKYVDDYLHYNTSDQQIYYGDPSSTTVAAPLDAATLADMDITFVYAKTEKINCYSGTTSDCIYLDKGVSIPVQAYGGYYKLKVSDIISAFADAGYIITPGDLYNGCDNNYCDYGTRTWHYSLKSPYSSIQEEIQFTSLSSNYGKIHALVTDILSYDLNGGTGSTPDFIKTKSGIPVTLADGTGIHRENYEFLGWSLDGSAPALHTYTLDGNDVTLKAVWKKLNAEYKIEYFKQDVADSMKYITCSTTTHAGIIGNLVTVTPDAISGFHLNADQSVTSAAIAEDETTNLKIYYDRDTYAVEGILDGEKTSSQNVMFEATSSAIRFNAPPNAHIISVKVSQGGIETTPSDFEIGKNTYDYAQQSNVREPITVTVITDMDKVQIIATKTGEGKGQIISEGAINFNYNSSPIYTITPDQDSYIEFVSIDGIALDVTEVEDISKTGAYTFTNVVTGHAISVQFAPKHNVIITADSASKVYDGTVLADNGWQDTTPAGLVAGDKILYVAVTGSALNVGNVTNSAIYAVIGSPYQREGDSQASSEEQLDWVRSHIAEAFVLYGTNSKELNDEVNSIISDWGKNVTSTYKIVYKDGTLTVTAAGGSSGGHKHSSSQATTIQDKEVPLAGTPQLDKVDHFNYINGYEDGTVKAQSNITREEVATIFYRLLTDSSRAIYFAQDEEFSDIASNRWSADAVATLAKGAIIQGYKDGTFDAGRPITRAEFAAIASRFDPLEDSGGTNFSDISGHWAEKYILSATKKGWITGYSNGTFKPDQYITRAEAMTLINRVLDRRVDEKGLIDGYKLFPDNKPTDWFYYQVIEATNNHDYTPRTKVSDMETWTKIKADKTWK